MGSPFFSIIIPTRNRYETLQYAIRTVLSQEFDSFELIISDNSDPANLHEVELIREYLDDERVRYCRPASVLSMSDNWEFAVSNANGEFIIVFGDDDGLVSGALGHIYNIIKKTKRQLVSWARVEYSWPDRAPQEYANLMVIPYAAKTGIVDSKGFITKVISGRGDYRYFPMLYNAAVSRTLIDALIAKTGRIFSSACPDIYTGYAFAHLEKEYITIGYPLSINGVSSKSTGAAHLAEENPTGEDYWKTFRTSEIKWPQEIPEINSPYLGIIEPYIQLSKFFPEISNYISRERIYKIIVDTLASANVQDLEDKLGRILDSAKNEKSLHKWLVRYIHKVNPGVNPGNPGGYESRIGFDGSHLILDASKFGLENVYDVSIFIGNLFGEVKDKNYLKPVSYSFIKRAKKAAGILLRKNTF
jgi:glycosyltransferase involved in cell wall biosynthesis